jgi:hypothetical protein
MVGLDQTPQLLQIVAGMEELVQTHQTVPRTTQTVVVMGEMNPILRKTPKIVQETVRME